MTSRIYQDVRQWAVDHGIKVTESSLDPAKAGELLIAYAVGLGKTTPAVETGAKRSGEIAFRMAGITRDDIGTCQLYDCYTYTKALDHTPAPPQCDRS